MGSREGGQRITAVAGDSLTAGSSTPGIVRGLAFEVQRATLMRARVAGGVVSGWHHHGSRDVLGYVAQGRARFDFGPGGRESIEVESGGFFHVPPGLIHRDVNPTDKPQEIILSFIGTGPLVVNVDGSEPD